MIKYISFSGGVESTTMCVMFGHKADAIFSDTGFEHAEVYERIERVERYCQDKIRPDFKVHKISNGSLIDYIKESKFYPNHHARFCTRMFKIEPIDDFLSTFDEVELMIGLNADETERTGNHGNKKNVTYSYPLIEHNLTRQNCVDILNAIDLHPSFPAYMKRGGCVGCYYKSVREYQAMALLNPDEFKVVEDLENEIQDRRKEFFSIHASKTMKQIRESTENMLFKPEEIYPTINDATNCGVFCNR